MADLLVRTKVRAGFYRVGQHCIHKGRRRWGVYHGVTVLKQFLSLDDAHRWSSDNQPATEGRASKDQEVA